MVAWSPGPRSRTSRTARTRTPTGERLRIPPSVRRSDASARRAPPFERSPGYLARASRSRTSRATSGRCSAARPTQMPYYAAARRDRKQSPVATAPRFNGVPPQTYHGPIYRPNAPPPVRMAPSYGGGGVGMRATRTPQWWRAARSAVVAVAGRPSITAVGAARLSRRRRRVIIAVAVAVHRRRWRRWWLSPAVDLDQFAHVRSLAQRRRRRRPAPLRSITMRLWRMAASRSSFPLLAACVVSHGDRRSTAAARTTRSRSPSSSTRTRR